MKRVPMKAKAATPLARRNGLCRTGSRYSNRRTMRRLVRSSQGVDGKHAEEQGREEHPTQEVRADRRAEEGERRL